MAQIQSPETYVDGQQVTAARLNNQTNGAILLPGAVTDQTALAAGTVATGDQVILHDASTTALRKATAGDLLGSGLPIVTDSISATSGNGVQIVSNNGSVVAGSSYTSGDGLTVTVTTPSAHGLAAGNIVTITLAGTGYNGTFALTSASGSTFVYVLSTAATAGSGSLSYQKQGTLQANGNISVTGQVYSNGIVNSGNITTTGNLTVAGTTTMTGNATASGNLAVAGSLTAGGNPVQKRVDTAVITLSLPTGTQYTYTTVAAWTNIPLNTISQNNSFVVNSASFTGTGTSHSDITLPAGTYQVQASVMVQSQGGAGGIVPRIRNATSGVVIAQGFVAHCGGFSNSASTCYAIFTLAVQSTINIQYWIGVNGSATFATTQIGLTGSATETLFPVVITKLD